MGKLKRIQSNRDFTKIHRADVDLVLTDEDVDALQEAEEDLRKGKTKRLA